MGRDAPVAARVGSTRSTFGVSERGGVLVGCPGRGRHGRVGERQELAEVLRVKSDSTYCAKLP